MSANKINDLVNFVSDSQQYYMPQQMLGQYYIPQQMPGQYYMPQQMPGQYYMPYMFPQQMPGQYYMPQQMLERTRSRSSLKRTRSKSPPRASKRTRTRSPPRAKRIKTLDINCDKICDNILTDIGWVDQKAFDIDIDNISLSSKLCSEFRENTTKYRKHDDLYIKYFVRYENHTTDSHKIINTEIFHSFLNKFVEKNKKLKSFEVRYYVGLGFRYKDQKLFNATPNDGFLMIISFILA